MANGQQSTNNNTKDTRASDGKDKDKDKDSSAKAPAATQPKGSEPAPAKTGGDSAKK